IGPPSFPAVYGEQPLAAITRPGGTPTAGYDLPERQGGTPTAGYDLPPRQGATPMVANNRAAAPTHQQEREYDSSTDIAALQRKIAADSLEYRRTADAADA